RIRPLHRLIPSHRAFLDGRSRAAENAGCGSSIQADFVGGTIMNTKLLISIFAAAAALSINAYAADQVTSSDANSIVNGYVRAGGLIGVDRVSGLKAGGAQVGVAYDADVAARTNMPRAQGAAQTVGVSYDADVAARTNMPRGGDAQVPHKAAGVEG